MKMSGHASIGKMTLSKRNVTQAIYSVALKYVFQRIEIKLLLLLLFQLFS